MYSVSQAHRIRASLTPERSGLILPAHFASQARKMRASLSLKHETNLLFLGHENQPEIH
jgi:hypothetical protein